MPRKPSVSTEEITEMYQQGLSTREISVRLCVNRRTVYRHLTAAGIAYRAKRGRLSSAFKEICKPPVSCFECPYPDCMAATKASGSGKRTAAEAEYLLCSGNS